MMSNKELRFGFGKNWENYVKRNLNEERINISNKHLLEFIELENLEGKTFLDIGCGSGLHSLAAFRSGAKQIYSFDYDIKSVKASMIAHKYAGSPDNWRVVQGSILDDNFIASITPADIVYSWGVLHHTGEMWKALDNTIRLAKKDSLLYIALYDHDIHVNPTPEFWLDIKKTYNLSSWLGKRKMELWYVWNFTMNQKLSNLPELISRTLNYKQSRGMALYTDIKDWLGGWPMDFAKRADVKKWSDKNGLEMVKIKTGEANTEYLFKKK